MIKDDDNDDKARVKPKPKLELTLPVVVKNMTEREKLSIIVFRYILIQKDFSVSS